VRVNINGQQFDIPDKNDTSAVEQFKSIYKCNCAIYSPNQYGYGVCSITNTPIPNIDYCNECLAKNETDYTQIK